MEKESFFSTRSFGIRIVKALVKTGVIYILFVIFSRILLPLESILNIHESLNAFFYLFLIFVFATEFFKDTVLQHVFSVANSLAVVFYFAYALDTGVLRFSVQQTYLMIDIRFFFSLLIISGILSFAKSLLQSINWASKREERLLNYPIKSL
jgi:hypothetical protein